MVDISALTGGPWQSYTPTWTATTNPLLGNGSLSGRYTRAGRLIVGTIALAAGSTTSFGAGPWLLGLPIQASTANITPIGQATARSNGGNYAAGTAVLQSPTTLSVLFGSTWSAVGNPAAPFWAAGDVLRLNFSYEAAS